MTKSGDIPSQCLWNEAELKPLVVALNKSLQACLGDPNHPFNTLWKCILSFFKMLEVGNKFIINLGCSLLSTSSFLLLFGLLGGTFGRQLGFWLVCKAAYRYLSKESSIGTAPVGSTSSAKTLLSINSNLTWFMTPDRYWQTRTLSSSDQSVVAWVTPAWCFAHKSTHRQTSSSSKQN